MRAILWQYGKSFLRNPWIILLMFGLTVLFGAVVGGSIGGEDNQDINVYVYGTDLKNDQLEQKVEELNNESNIQFNIITQTEALERIRNQNSEAVVHLQESTYEFLVSREGTPIVTMVKPILDQFYTMQKLTSTVGEDALVKMNELNNVFTVDKEPMRVGDQKDYALTSLFGFSLFFVVFTISFTILHILELRESGIWDRLILSPTTKWSMYAGNIFYSFLLGYGQIAIVLIVFKYIFGYSFYGGFGKLFVVIIPFVFAITSIGVFLSGVVKNSQQLSAIIPLVANLFAMLGGAFWPLDIVPEWLLKLSYASPIMYGMEMMNGVTVYNWTFEQFLFPSAVLFFMGAAVIGIGLNLMERKSV